MSPSIEPGLCAFGAQVLLTHLSALEAEMEGVRTAGADIEHIHRMRVATRRLRAALPLFLACLPEKKAAAWEGEIRRITRALGAARDADVQIDVLMDYARKVEAPAHKPGIARLQLRLNQYRSTLQPMVVRALDRFARTGVLAAMTAELSETAAGPAGTPHPQALYLHARDSVLPRLDEFLAFDAIVARPEQVEELHAMRIAAKRLRYTLETFAPLYANGLKPWLPSIRDHQEALGNIHDCDVWSVFLPEFLEQEEKRVLAFYGYKRPYYRLLPGIQAFLANRQERRARLYTTFVAEWEKQQRKRLWQGLVETVQMPVFRVNSLYPPSLPLEPGSE
jgi:CHAD domain-containing protein